MVINYALHPYGIIMERYAFDKTQDENGEHTWWSYPDVL